MRYQYEEFPYVTPAPLAAGRAEDRCAVAIVGAGPVGLSLAIDLALRGQASVVLDDNNVVSVGSRAICWAKRTLEIFDRLGIGDRVLAKGVTWKIGRLYEGEDEVFAFDLLPEDGHRMPAFVNLQQYYVEQYLVERARDFPDLIDLRFRNRVAGLAPHDDATFKSGATLTVETPDGPYALHADWTVACDGAKSPLRGLMGLGFDGVGFEERFLIADVEMRADMPSERRFWFHPPFHPEHSVLMHKQPDDIWRIDWQLGRDADPEAEREPERVRARVARVVGDRPFTLDWVSVYSFQCRRMARFVHGRVLFAGDAAHVVSPFGARGGNGGVQDADNLAWKLAAALKGAPESLIDSYDAERQAAADENILNSTRATNFISPKAGTEQVYRDAVLALARKAGFARRMVNTGRLSTPKWLDGGPLNGPDAAGLPPLTRPGAPCVDAPLGEGWLLQALGGGFALLALGEAAGARLPGATTIQAPEPDRWLRARYLGAAPGAAYLIRPDQHVAARWTAFDPAAAAAALARAGRRA